MEKRPKSGSGAKKEGKHSHPKQQHRHQRKISKQNGRQSSRVPEVSKNTAGPLFTGTVIITARGSGIVRDRANETAFEVPTHKLNTALHGDSVEIRIQKPATKERDGLGEVVRVVRRSKKFHTGKIVKRGTDYFLEASDVRLNDPIRITKWKNDINPQTDIEKNTLVAIEIHEWKNGTPSGTVVKIIGSSDSPEAIGRAFAMERGFDNTFPKAVEEDARHIHQTFSIEQELPNRTDLRHLTTCTIDPSDAKDFDDALSFEKQENGDIVVGIHIADVAHFVRPDTAIDREARERATSVYLVDRTIPMLPEVLSNDLCSLTPNTDKLAMSVLVTFDAQHKMKKVWFGNTVIHSRRRFTYEEAFETLSTGTDDWASILKTLNSIAKELREKRIANGAISLESDEIKFVLNEHGFPIAVKKKVRNDAHKLIEEFMLLANTLVAEELSDETKKDEEEPMLFRVHERPTLEKMNDLSLYLRGLGHSVEMKNGIIPTTTLIRVVKETDDKDLREIMQGVIIRSMQKAVYTTKNKGHFGLALSHYTHFTSPIRRYPDTVIHRLLKEYVAHGDIKKKDIEAYNDIAEHASMRESDAQEAERASDKYFQTLFMMDKIGTETRGTVTGMSDRGIFVRDDTSFAEGFVRFRGNFEESFVVDKKRMQVRGEKTGIVFSLGDKLTLRVDGANPERREIDYSVIL